MPNIDFNKFNHQPPEKTTKEYTISGIKTEVHQYYIKEMDILIDIVDLDFDGRGPGMEFYISFLGEDFKLRCNEILSKEEFENLDDLPGFLLDLAEIYQPCLECKKKFLDGLCEAERELEDSLDIEIYPGKPKNDNNNPDEKA